MAEIIKTMQKYKLGVISILLINCFIFLYIYFSSNFIINNGDYFRVTKGIIEIMPWTQTQACPTLHSFSDYPSSTLGFVFFIFSYLEKILGASCLKIQHFAFFTFAIFSSGCYVALKTNKNLFSAIFSCSIIAFILADFFNSVYEELALLAFLPWMIFGFAQLQKRKIYVFLFFSSAILFAKTQMVVLLPFFFFVLYNRLRDGRLSSKELFTSYAILICVAIISIHTRSENVTPNAYNRLFNGIGWSSLDVSSWPCESFTCRHKYFYSHVNVLQEKLIKPIVPEELNELVGTSYWPTGIQIFEKVYSKNVNLDLVNYTLKPVFFLKTISNPDIFLKSIREVYIITFTSDYKLSYLYKNIEQNQSKISKIKAFVLGNAGVFLILAGIIGIASERSDLRFLAFIILLMPMMIFCGDGFYEFEKHFLAYFIIFPLVLIRI